MAVFSILAAAILVSRRANAEELEIGVQDGTMTAYLPFLKGDDPELVVTEELALGVAGGVRRPWLTLILGLGVDGKERWSIFFTGVDGGDIWLTLRFFGGVDCGDSGILTPGGVVEFWSALAGVSGVSSLCSLSRLFLLHLLPLTGRAAIGIILSEPQTV